MWSGFFRSLVAVLMGNLVYFAITPYVPRLAQHNIFRIDYGLVIDFWICLVIWGLLAWVSRQSRHRTRKQR
jgi:TctA family transporter